MSRRTVRGCWRRLPPRRGWPLASAIPSPRLPEAGSILPPMQETSSPTATPSIGDDLLQAARAFFPDMTAAVAIAGHPDVVQIITPMGTGRARRWPAGVLADDIAFCHEVMVTARDAGLTLVPQVVLPPTAP